MRQDFYEQPKLQARKDWMAGLQDPPDNPYPPGCDAHQEWETERDLIEKTIPRIAA